MSIVTYSPEDVIILLGGVYAVEGLVEGSFVSIAKETPQYNTTITADGRVSRSSVEDPTHTITINLNSFSDSNLIFTAWVAADELVQSAMFPLLIKDGMGSTLFYTPLCWVESTAEVEFDIGITGREWVLRSAGGKLVTGGNGDSIVDSNLVALGLVAADFGGLL
jgi:hypothetical protein